MSFSGKWIDYSIMALSSKKTNIVCFLLYAESRTEEEGQESKKDYLGQERRTIE